MKYWMRFFEKVGGAGGNCIREVGRKLTGSDSKEVSENDSSWLRLAGGGWGVMWVR
jgi:hypothetical protein